ITAVERIVNEKVAADLPVHFEFLTVPEARTRNAIGLFDEKYEEKVKVYFIGEYSREFCGGPHVEHTKQVGRVRIQKEEAVGAGVRRIKAVVDDSFG
ncbi:MAG: alanine--tRNA ligase, partial [Candidatus Kerfeldbacteria bacterium]|nr:alanine--tRNA ligase [Candidatus Kerfeldbacteria bacterium]